jgi:hypothetical protein
VAKAIRRSRSRSITWRAGILLWSIVLTLPALLVASPAQAASNVIYCYINAQNPHASTHVRGTVNAVGTVSCSAGVDYILTTVTLVRDGQYVSPSGSCTSRFGDSSASCNAAEECRSGSTYFSRVSVSAFKSGYQTVVNGSPAWSNQVVVNCWALDPGVNMPVGASLASPNLAYRFYMQGDGNLVEYGPRGAVWASCTQRWPGSIASMQTDGNFVVYGPGHIARWATGTSAPGSGLEVQDDGNIVIYAPGHVAVWASAQHRVC